MKYIVPILLLLAACTGGDANKIEQTVRDAAAKRGLKIDAVDCFRCGSTADWCTCQVTVNQKPYTVRCSSKRCRAFELSVSD